jgi:N-acyl-D-amino-acid deacylase
MFDLVIQNGAVVDGTKAPRYRADVAVVGDRIQQIGDLRAAAARTRIDATNKVIAPGFIDVHTHADGWLLKTPHFISKTMQGFTSEVIMADGISYAPVSRENAGDWVFYLRALDALTAGEYRGWESLEDYMKLLHRRTAQNVATHVPYANVRALSCGFTRATPDDYQMKSMIAEIERGMAAGAVGLSTGLDYIAECFASTDELVEACQPLKASRGLYVTHVRYKKGTVNGIKEAVEIGRRAGVPVHISHMKGATAQECDAVLDYVNKVAVNEVDFSFDVYPYRPGSTMLNYLLPYEVWEDGPLGVMARLNEPFIRAQFSRSLAGFDLEATYIAWLPSRHNAGLIGKTLAEYARSIDRAPADACCDLLIEEGLSVLLVFAGGDDTFVDPFLAHPKYMMGTDGIFHEQSVVHPRQYGSAARLLGPCVRDRKLFSIEEAVHKMTGGPAERFGLVQRGALREGNFADVVIFDPITISDRATYKEPHQFSVGVEEVLVNGTPIIRQGKPVENLEKGWPGRRLAFKS